MVASNGTAQSVLSRGVVVRVFRDTLDHCAAPQNPCEATFRDGSSDRSVRCQSLVENGKCTVLPYSPTLIRVRRSEKPTHVRPRTQHRPGGIGKSQSAKASSMILTVLALVARRQAAPLKSPATTSTCSSSITARIVRSMPRFWA